MKRRCTSSDETIVGSEETRTRSLHCVSTASHVSLHTATNHSTQPIRSSITLFCKIAFYSLGTRSVLLTIIAAHAPNIRLTTCRSPCPPDFPHTVTIPPGSPSLPSIQPFLTQ